MHLTQYLRDYLLGLLGEEETELIDQLAVTNDDVASLLCLIEDDLVDAYVRGCLAGDLLEGFECFYLASPRRRARVSFATELLRIAGS